MKFDFKLDDIILLTSGEVFTISTIINDPSSIWFFVREVNRIVHESEVSSIIDNLFE